MWFFKISFNYLHTQKNSVLTIAGQALFFSCCNPVTAGPEAPSSLHRSHRNSLGEIFLEHDKDRYDRNGT